MKTEKKQLKIATNGSKERALKEERNSQKILNEDVNFNYSPKCNRLKPNMPENEDAKNLKNK